ncbi:MAG TPA: glycosyltransferase family 2 protein [Burkholderiales bacterium]|nr:glycosyltransferase family 2 protein [Burkholderiales bacterium]
MKFSILLPTRNRLELLKLAIESVRGQDFPEWEIVVSDNASTDDVGAYLRQLADPRIRVRHHESPVSVTANWNAALEKSRGDYVIMLGDDDALLPGALSATAALIDTWGQPDAVYAQARQYGYPGVIPGQPEAFMQTGYNAFLAGRNKAFLLPRETAVKMVRGAMAFRVLYGFNMQHFVVSRKLVEALLYKGPFFQSPYPDYYAANAVLLAAERLVASPQPFALIGISPKSFGFYYFNERESDGVAFLQNVTEPDIAERLRGELVPGSNMNDSWLCAMQTLARNFPDAVGAAVSFARYRRLQYHELLRAGRRGAVLQSMRWWEFPLYGGAALAYALARFLPRSKALRETIIHVLFSPAPRFDPERVSVPHRDILEAANARDA